MYSDTPGTDSPIYGGGRLYGAMMVASPRIATLPPVSMVAHTFASNPVGVVNARLRKIK